MKSRFLAVASAALLWCAPAHAQFVFKGGSSGGGGGGTVTSVTAGACLTATPNPVVGAGTIAGTYVLNPQTGTTYTIDATDACKLVTFSNGSPVAVTLPQATGSFGAGYSFDVENLGAGTVTVTPTTSTINGAASLQITQNRGCTIVSDGTNYQVSACTALVSAGGSGTVNSGTTPGVAYYATTGTAVSDGTSALAALGGLNVTSTTAGVTNGIQLQSSNTPCIYSNTTCRLTFSGTSTTSQGAAILDSNSGGYQLDPGASSCTAPKIRPRRTDATTGIGSGATNQVCVGINAVEKTRWTSEGLMPIQATTPTCTGTGTPTISARSTDDAGSCTAGASATSVVITFNLTHTNAPFCVVTSQTQLAAFAYTVSNTAITVTQTATSGNVVQYKCTPN